MTPGLASNPLVAATTAALFSGLSRLRGRRIFHPHGVGFMGTLVPVGAGRTGAALFDGAEQVPAVVRLSRSVGLPENLRDPCGLAVRVPDAYGRGLHQDFLLVSSSLPPVARHLLLPSGGFSDRPYSSLLPYRLGGQTVLVGAQPLDSASNLTLAELRDRDRADLGFAITLAHPAGEWREVAELRVEGRLPGVVTERLRMNPAHSGGGLEPIGFLNALRPAAYRGSQEGRRDRSAVRATSRRGIRRHGDETEEEDRPEDIEDQLIEHLTDVHSIEEQALTQMRQAPDIAGDPELAAIFERHLLETERQERLVRKRLQAHGADPSKVKDLVARAGGLGMLMFARFSPDTPGKLVNHAFSYEHMEIAAYELLAGVAEQAGDKETVLVAREIADEEREMAERLAASFDLAVAASLRDQDPDDLDEQLNSYLADAHAIEQQSIALLEGGQRIVKEEGAMALFRQHLDETRDQARHVADRLVARGSGPSKVKDVGMRLGGFNVGAFFGAQPDTPAKLIGFAYAFEHLEIAGYEQLRRVAERAGDQQTIDLAAEIADGERGTARQIAELWGPAVDAALAEQGIDARAAARG
jgi:ferritin-like metal-binding protein YciE